MQTGAAYIRVSTDEQSEYSPEAQLNAIYEYAKRNNIVIGDDLVFKDEGFSGRKAEKRPAFQKMIATAKIKPKRFDIILVHKFDRFARSREDSVVYKSLLRKECGVKVVSITEQLEDDKFSIILESMLEAMAEYYSLNLSEEVKKGMKEKARRGGVQAAAPFGYKVENNKYIIDKYEGEIVKQIFNKFVNGESYLNIARELNSLGVKTRRGNLIESRTIQYIIRNPAYIGKTRWNPAGKTRRNFNHPDLIIADGAHEAIIDNETFKLAQKRAQQLQSAYRPYYKQPVKNVSHWLFGVIRCGNCGATLVKNNRFFQCGAYNKGKCGISHFIKIKDIEEIVLKTLSEDFTIERKNLNILAANKIIKNDFFLERQLEHVKLKMQRLKSAFENGIDTIDEYRENKKNITAEISAVESAIKTQNEIFNNDKEISELTRNIHNVYLVLKSPIYETEEKNHALRTIIKEIIYNKPKKELLIVYFR